MCEFIKISRLATVNACCCLGSAGGEGGDWVRNLYCVTGTSVSLYYSPCDPIGRLHVTVVSEESKVQECMVV